MRWKFLTLLSFLANIILATLLISEVQKSSKQGFPTSGNNKNAEFTNPLVTSKSEQIENKAKVTKVIDGDTVSLESGETIRYIGIDTPEVSQGKECFAEEATKANQELVLGKVVRLEKDISEKDRYKRLLRYLWVDSESGEIFVNEYLVRQGFALAVTYPPDVKYSDLFREAEKEARDKNSGLWGKCQTNVKESSQVSQAPEDDDRSTESNQEQLTFADSNWDCSANTYNCTDFKTHLDAQNAFESCGGNSNDIHKLDSDGDGIACESLP
jgi:micrococcal nuclease